MFAQFIVVVAALLALTSATDLSFGTKRFGFGAQKLKKNFVTSSATTDCGNSVEYYFKDAVVDNFAPVESQQKWAGNGQRYWVNKELWGGVGHPIIVFIGGEGEETCLRLSKKMYAYNLAEEHNALMINVEHRFYGQSYPTEGMSTKELSYLSADQALADLARVIQFVKKSYSTTGSKVITIGGSYPGNMAAWFRLKYPSVTSGSVASSAPVTAKTNFYEYMEVVGQSLIYFSGKQCYGAFESAALQVAKLASQGFGSAGMKQLEKDFATCSSIESELDLAVLLSDLMGNVQGTVQYNNEHNGVLNVTDICGTMLAGSDPYTQFVQLSAQFRGDTCEDASWADTVAYMSATAKDHTNAARPWVYQTCSEFGYYQTTDSPNQPFHSWKPVNMAFSRAICAASFDGWKSDPDVEWVNNVYGDVRIAGTNIIFPSGTIDPWHALGVTNYTAALPQSSESPLYILGTAHCNDLYAPASSDPPSLTAAREQVAAKVAEWLK